MGNIRTDEIVAFAKDIRQHWGSDAIEIAEHLGMRVVFSKGTNDGAFTMKMNDYPTIISIPEKSGYAARQVLCAHELGHALLHESGINWFEGTYKTIVNDVEYEANLFAVALLFDEDDFKIPFSDMTNYMLKSVLDYNLR